MLHASPALGGEVTGASETESMTAEAVFSAALTLAAILICVIGIFKSEIGQLEEKGLPYLAESQSRALCATTVFFIVCAWSTFFSLLALIGMNVARWLYLLPLGLATVALLFAVPYWVWFF